MSIATVFLYLGLAVLIVVFLVIGVVIYALGTEKEENDDKGDDVEGWR